MRYEIEERHEFVVVAYDDDRGRVLKEYRWRTQSAAEKFKADMEDADEA